MSSLSTFRRAHFGRRELDRELAAGLPVDTDRARGARAAQLMNDRERARVAGCLENILQAAQERHADPTSVLRLNHAEVLAAHHDIVALIDTLCSERALSPCGLARARLLTDDDSPLLVARTGTTVRGAVSRATAAM